MHRSQSRRLAIALGLALPLASVGASADPRPWSDPPAKSAAKSTPDAESASGAKSTSEAKSIPASNSTPEAKSTLRPGAAPTTASTDGTKAAAAPIRDDASSGSPSDAVKAVASRPGVPASRGPDAAGADAGHMRFQGSADRARSAGRGAKPVRRLADTPSASPVAFPATSPATPRATIQAGRGPAPGARAGAAQALAARYLAAVSGPDEAMVGASHRFYGTQVRFYGRATTLAALMAEKRGFVRRWPERRYEPRAFRTTCAPGGDTCTVRALVAFRAASPARGVVSRGSTELVLDVSFAGARPVIVAESGRVLRRGA